MRRLALITGASSGIGAAFAEEYARRGFDLALAARRAERLEALAVRLQAAHGAQSICLPGDLADPLFRDGLCARLGRAVDVLVNNAGYGLPGGVAQVDWSAQRAFLELLAIAPTDLARQVLPGMIARGYGRIVNVSSVLGFAPGAASLYPAVKSYLIKMSQALRQETLGTGVHVTALCPGLTHSEFHDVSGLRRALEKIPALFWQEAGAVAAFGARACEANRAIAVPGFINQLSAFALRVIPDDWLLPFSPKPAKARK